ncbi:class I SAM-dependent methyltransferase [Methanolobus mangrovi]|uniref:Class I SAM-dependent methyltransferase n=1 Tax=Methanolobus mangrovi TaxID=3072977 RepID=A0AA51YIG7_9EURY|nr:class I SAM-dependent methyltransferase [Methanolobus mangrovi]WMW21528.1 class I SAM-dependent methyltransferase [Methanolobus mangrovi]
MKINHKKGNNFGWFFGGRHYDFFATILGFGHSYYEQVASTLPLENGMSVLDIGCGTESVGIAVSELMGGDVSVHGLDLSGVQLGYATDKGKKAGVSLHLYKGSMDMLPFKNRVFDLVVTSVAFCETTSDVRKGAIGEVSRVLKDNAYFAIIDCAKPLLGMDTVMMLPFFMFKENADSWNNHYPDICIENNLVLEKDVYLKSYVKCQLFRKAD